jgi:hypothetical protein
MNWKLILQLSLFGLAMGIATVFFIPSTIEPLFWLAVFIVCAYVIARRAPDRYFVHGLMVSLVNSVWVTGAHVLLFSQYAAHHPEEMAMMSSMPLADHPRRMMMIVGPIVGVVSGFVLGLFAVVAHRLVRSKVSAAA